MFTRSKSPNEPSRLPLRPSPLRFFSSTVFRETQKNSSESRFLNNVDGGDNLSCFLIKDLRTKCVFPNGLSYNSCFEPKKFEEGSVEESAQSTPPDIDLFVDTKEAEENGNPNVGFVPEKQSNKIDQKNSRIKSVCSFLGHAFELSFLKHQVHSVIEDCFPI